MRLQVVLQLGHGYHDLRVAKESSGLQHVYIVKLSSSRQLQRIFFFSYLILLYSIFKWSKSDLKYQTILNTSVKSLVIFGPYTSPGTED